jgi:endonuclease-3
MAETLEQRKKRARRILSRLAKLYAEANCALEHDHAWQLLISTILSAQSTDDTVNKVTRVLYKKYKTPKALARAPREEVEKAIHATGFFRQKAKNIQATCQILVEHHGGEVPESMGELTALPGVARKTANVVLGTWFGRNEGVVVDTHVGRISERLALTWQAKNSKDAVKIEQDLMTVLPRPKWTHFSHALILHGRQVCTARNPKCEECGLKDSCPSACQIEAPQRRGAAS